VIANAILLEAYLPSRQRQPLYDLITLAQERAAEVERLTKEKKTWNERLANQSDVDALMEEVEALQSRERELRAALTDVFALIDSGYLVRNIADDAEPGWAMRQLHNVQRLAKAYAVSLTTSREGEKT
jgi:hypothetical protein